MGRGGAVDPSLLAVLRWCTAENCERARWRRATSLPAALREPAVRTPAVAAALREVVGLRRSLYPPSPEDGELPPSDGKSTTTRVPGLRPRRTAIPDTTEGIRQGAPSLAEGPGATSPRALAAVLRRSELTILGEVMAAAMDWESGAARQR